MCNAFVGSVFFIFIGAGESDPEYGTILMLSRDHMSMCQESMCLCMSEIFIVGKYSL